MTKIEKFCKEYGYPFRKHKPWDGDEPTPHVMVFMEPKERKPFLEIVMWSYKFEEHKRGTKEHLGKVGHSQLMINRQIAEDGELEIYPIEQEAVDKLLEEIKEFNKGERKWKENLE